MQQIDRFRKHGEIRPLGCCKFNPAGGLAQRLLQIGETSVPERDGCNRLFVHGASFPQSDLRPCNAALQSSGMISTSVDHAARIAARNLLRQPSVQMFRDELVVIQKGYEE